MTSRWTLPTSRRLALVLAIGILTLIAATASPVAAAASSADAAPVAAGSAGAAVPATDQIDFRCPPDSLCLFMHRDFGGEVFVVPAGASFPNLHLFPCLPFCDSPKHGAGDGNFGDQMSSFINNTSLRYCWWFDINFRNLVSEFFPLTFNTWVGRFLQDELSSVAPC
jgi:peptidase inhibitor family I36